MALFGFEQQQVRDAVERSVSVMLEDDKRQMTALAIADARADILCLQEVDNLGVLEAFFSNYVHRVAEHRYGNFRLVKGNDERGIEVAFACRRDLVAPDRVAWRSHKTASYGDLDVFDEDLAVAGLRPDAPLFKRDCLEVTLDIGGRSLSLFVCHFKSMGNGRDDGRMRTTPVRRAEARAIRRIIESRFGEAWRERDWVVAGDLNDYVESIGPLGVVADARPSAIDPLLDGFAVNPVAQLPPHQRWNSLSSRLERHRASARRRACTARLSSALAGARVARAGRSRNLATRPAVPGAARSARAGSLDRRPVRSRRPISARRMGSTQGLRSLSRHRHGDAC